MKSYSLLVARDSLIFGSFYSKWGQSRSSVATCRFNRSFSKFLITLALVTAQTKRPYIKIATFFIHNRNTNINIYGLSLNWLNFVEMDLLNTLGNLIRNVVGLTVCFLVPIHNLLLARFANSVDRNS